MPLLREDQAAIHVTVEDVDLDNDPWSQLEGGDVTAADVKTRPGGMQPEKNLGGPATRNDATVRRQYSSDNLHVHLHKLEQVCGKAAMHIAYTPLDADGNTHGKTVTIHGILKGVQRPNADANNSAAQFLTLVMGCNYDSSESSN